MRILKVFKGKNGKQLMIVGLRAREYGHFDQFIETESGERYVVLSTSVLNGVDHDDHHIAMNELKDLLGDRFQSATAVTTTGAPFEYGDLTNTKSPGSVVVVPTDPNNLHLFNGPRQSDVSKAVYDLATQIAESQNKPIVALCSASSLIAKKAYCFTEDTSSSSSSNLIELMITEAFECVVVVDDYDRRSSKDVLIELANNYPDCTFIAGASFDTLDVNQTET